MDAQQFLSRYSTGKRYFQGICLNQANLRRARLSMVSLHQADLSGADLSGAVRLVG